MKIEVKGLSWSAGRRRILDDVSFSLEGDRIYGIAGPNGCGKTTLLRHLYRQYPSKGRVFLNDRPVEQYSRKEYARQIAVMAQTQAYGESELRVGEVVINGRFPYKKAMLPYNREDEAIVEDVLRRTDLWQMRNRKIRTLSGGELQRVLISKCLVQQPGAILLDEPTNHLDIRYKLELMGLLKDFGGMVILTIHDLNLAARYCDELLLMKDGRLIARGDPGEALSAENVGYAFGVEVPVIRLDGRTYLGV